MGDVGWEDPLEKEMATHSSTLVWKIPWMEEPGRLQSKGSQRVGHDWAALLVEDWWPTGGHMFISDLLLSLGDRISSLVQKTTIKKVYGTTKLGFSEYNKRKQTSKTLARENKSSWRCSALQLPFRIPSCYSDCWQAVNGSSHCHV